MKRKSYEKYNDQLKKILKEKFKDLTMEEIEKLPVEVLKVNTPIDDNAKEESIRVKEKINKRHFEFLREKRKIEKNRLVFNSKRVLKILTEEEILENIEKVSQGEKVTITFLQRSFNISYPKASNMLDKLIDYGIVLKNEKTILDRDRLKAFLNETFAF